MNERANRPLPGTLYYRYEKAGLVFEHPPIPWNAEAVIVEANLRFPGYQRKGYARPGNSPIFARAPLKDQFTLQMGSTSLHPESLRLDDPEVPARLLFRLAVPNQSVLSELRYQDKLLGQLTLPVLRAEEFVGKLRMESVGLQARLGFSLVPCQTILTPQCPEVIAQAFLQSPTNLVPLFDLPFEAQLMNAQGEILKREKVFVGTGQLTGKQALVNVMFRRPRTAGNYWIAWTLAERELGRARLKVLSRAPFERSLRLAGTRFLLQPPSGDPRIVRTWPGQDGSFTRWAPCFIVSSSEAGMAAQFKVKIFRADHQGQRTIHCEQEVCLSDGPTPILAPFLKPEESEGIEYFALLGPKKELGILPLGTTPRAKFTGEGGIKEKFDFAWSQNAEEELEERLRKLLQGEG